VKTIVLVLALLSGSRCAGQQCSQSRQSAEYYATAYARHYGLPVEFVRAVIEQESGWRPCAVSAKGAVGLMQLMPSTAARLGVGNRCDIKQNISGGVRYLAWLNTRFHGDLRLVAAAYYAGEHIVDKRGLGYSNRDVVTYVANVRSGTERQKQVRSAGSCASENGRR
jgi:soluble lytic murein transglycosylase-like protein